MKIIRLDKVRVIYNDDSQYTIKTPLGDFNDITEAIQYYPNLSDDKHIKECTMCGKYFIDFTRAVNKKTCSKECQRKARNEYQLEYYYNKIFVKPKIDSAEYCTQKIKDYNNVNPMDLTRNNSGVFTEDDCYWGLGTGNLTEHPANNEDKEHKYIINEKRRLGI